MSTDERIGFFACVSADLRRHVEIETGQVNASAWSVLKRLFSPRFGPVYLCRLAQYSYWGPFKPLAKFYSLLNAFLFGIEITMRCEIGPGLYLPHTVGTVIGAWKIGSNAIIFQGVTLGAKQLDLRFDADLRPQLGNDVTIGAGAKVLGGVKIGNGVVVAANAVVLRDVADGDLVGGIPAKSLSKEEA